MRGRIRLVVLVLVCFGLMGVAPGGAASGRRSRVAVIKLKWHRITMPRRCRVGLLGWPWVLCQGDVPPGSASGTYELYNLDERTYKLVMVPPGYQPAELGAHWLALTGMNCSVGRAGEDCSFEFVFQNIETGQALSVPGYQPGGTMIPDLNSRGLGRTLCPRLRVGQGLVARGYGPPAAGLVLPAGGFAVVEQATQASGTSGPTAYDYLEGCRSDLHELISRSFDLPTEAPQGIVSNSHAVLWVGRGLQGLLVPSLRPFAVRPGNLHPTSLALTRARIYALASNGELFAARLPRALSR